MDRAISMTDVIVHQVAPGPTCATIVATSTPFLPVFWSVLSRSNTVVNLWIDGLMEYFRGRSAGLLRRSTCEEQSRTGILDLKHNSHVVGMAVFHLPRSIWFNTIRTLRVSLICMLSSRDFLPSHASLIRVCVVCARMQVYSGGSTTPLRRYLAWAPRGADRLFAAAYTSCCRHAVSPQHCESAFFPVPLPSPGTPIGRELRRSLLKRDVHRYD